MQREGGPVCKEQQVGVCVCVCVRKEIKTAEEVDSHLLLAAFLFPFLILFAQSLLFNPWSRRSCGRLNELLNPSSCWLSLYRERELLAATVLLLFLFFSPLSYRSLCSSTSAFPFPPSCFCLLALRVFLLTSALYLCVAMATST